MEIKNLTSNDFDDAVATGTVVVDFWADWCTPCKMLAPILDELAEKYEDVSVCKVNVDDEGQLAMRFGVQGIPSVLIFKEGELVQTLVGVRPIEDFEKVINTLQYN
jgi:thioredoxin 1